MSPTQKISVIERSLRCCRYGILSLIPLLGILTAVLAFRDVRFVRETCGVEWNPANGRLKTGTIFAAIGLILSTIVICFMIYPPGK